MKTEDGRTSNSTYKNQLTETIFQKQKFKIAELLTKKNELKSREKINSPFNTYADTNKIICFNDLNSINFENWEFSTFDAEFFNNELTPRYNNKFSESNIKPNSKGIEMRGIVFRSKDLINYENCYLELTMNFSLKGESILWLILRTEEKFDDNSSIIKISKEDRSQKMFISFGTFVYEDEKEELTFKIFTTQQLIDTSRAKNKTNLENDICDLKLHLIDLGDNIINVAIKVNENTYENCVKSMIFLPVMKKKRIMVAGSGQQVNIKNLYGKTIIRENNDNNNNNLLVNSSVFTNEKRNCDCCLIY